VVKTAFRALSVAAVAGLVLALGVASAAQAGPAVLARSSAGPGGGDPDTTVTFAVTSGVLSMSAPSTVDLGAAAPGTTISGALRSVTVTDDRALLFTSWIATAAATNWTTGSGNPAETIPARDGSYNPGTISTTGIITATGTPITLSGRPARDVTGSSGTGDDTATWIPVLSVAIPASAVGGTYSATLTESVF
jgi:hypothetical protein